MPSAAGWGTIVMGAVLLLPPAGTDSRERDFCRAWLGRSPAERHAVLVRSEEREIGSDAPAGCRAGLRAGLRRRLDAECRNWTALMDFEVRDVVDGVIGRCAGSR